MSIERPRLRSDVELLIAESEEEPLLLVRDPEMYVIDVAQFGVGVLSVLQFFDGSHTLEDVRAEFVKRGAGFVEVEQLQLLADTLNRACLLDNARYQEERDRRESFLKAAVRPAAHAGQAYPAERDQARRFLQGMLDTVTEPATAPLTRLIAPHIDLELGKDVYAHAHRRFAAAGRPDVVVVLGVRHDVGTRRFVACRKDFETPLGTVHHDAALLDALEKALSEDLSQGQIAHRDEHSVEFQALWLAHHWPDAPPKIVPLLVGSFHDLIEKGASPGSDGEIDAFVNALRRVIAADGRRVVVLASVDLAHMGPVYSDDAGLDADGERRMEDDDRSLLTHVLSGDAESFFGAIAETDNARHVCGVAPVYVTLRLGEGEGELLRYGQGRIHPESGSVVSYAAVSFAE